MAKQKQENKVTQQPVAPKPKVAKAMDGKRLIRIYALVVFLLGFCIYINSVRNEYNLDDELVTQTQTRDETLASGWRVVAPHRITSQGWDAIKLNFGAFGEDSLKGTSFGKHLKYFLPLVFREPYYKDKAGYQYEYRPVSLFSFALEHMLFSSTESQYGSTVEVENPHISHFINVLLYALMCTLLFFVLLKLFKNFNPLFAFAVALLFTAHPIHTEVVASIKNRDEILALAFGLLSLYFALRFVENGSVLNWLMIPLMFVLGILSKSTTITFAILIPLTVVILTGISFRKLLLVSVALVLPSVFFSRLYSVNQQILFVVALSASIILLYVLRNFPEITVRVKALSKNAVGLFDSHTKTEIEITPQLNFNFLRNPLVASSFVLLLLAVLSVGFAGIYMGKIWMSCLPVLLLCIVFLLVRAELQFLLITPISLLITFSMVKFNSSGVLIQSGLMVFLITQYFGGGKQFKTMVVVNFVVYSLASIIFLHSFFPLAVLFFAGFFNKRLLPLTFVMIAVSLFFVGRNVLALATGKTGFELGILGLPIIFISIFLLWKSKQHVLMRSSLLLLPVIMFLYFRFAPPSFNNDILSNIQSTYFQMNTTRAADLNPVQSVRPVYYIENPIQPTDPFSIKFGTAMSVLGKYLKQVFIPYPMSYYYGFAYFKPISITQTGPIIVFATYLILGLLGLLLIRRLPLVGFSILFYLAGIAVFSNLFIPVPGVMADRFLLIPSIGFCVLLVFLLFKAFRIQPDNLSLTVKNLGTPVIAVLSGVILVYGSLAIARNANWKDRITLFSHDIKVVENSAQAQNLLAVHLFIHSQEKQYQLADSIPARIAILEDAAGHFRTAIGIYSKFLNATYDLGRANYAIGSLYAGFYHNTAMANRYMDSAFHYYKQVQTIDTTFVTPCFEMGVIMDGRDSLQQAVYWYERFLTRITNQKEAYANLSYAYFRLGEYENSINTNKRALQYLPNSYEPTINIAKTYQQMQQLDSAIYYYEKSYVLNQNDMNLVKTLYNLSLKANNKAKSDSYALLLKQRGVALDK